MSTQPSITCRVCHRTSHNANDIREGYCGFCHAWTGLPPASCPTCKYEMGCASSVENGCTRPTAGDISLCVKCGEALIFNPDLTVRLAELNDLVALPGDTHKLIERAQKLIRKMRA